MQPPRNTRSVKDLFAGFDTTIRHYVVDRPRARIETIRRQFANLPQTNFRVGCDFAARGLWMDAAFRFRVATYLKPDYTQAYYNLGCAQAQLNRPDKAIAAFAQALKLKPDYEEARFMLSGLQPTSTPPRTMPRAMVRGFFESVAVEYDALAEASEYQGPRLVVEAAKPYLTKRQALQMLDVGCGTGLVARPWRALCQSILGIDLVPAMVAQAERARAGDNPVYDRVLTADILELPAGTVPAGSMDIVLCCDTAQFLGDLTSTLKLAAAALAPGGLFILTVEPHQAPQGYAVNRATARFGHHPDYARKLAATMGLELKRDGRVPLYADRTAQLYVFMKKAP